MNDILGLAINATSVYQKLFATASSNIAKSHTPGTSRLISEVVSQDSINGMSNGSKVQITRRVEAEYLRKGERENVSNHAEYEARSEYSNQINQFLSNEQNSLTNSMNAFFSSIDGLAREPGSYHHRATVLNAAKTLTGSINSMDAKFQDMDTNINNKITEIVKDINRIATSLVKLNTDIVTHSSDHSQPSELLDKRDLLLRDLSELVEVQVLANKDGSLNISIGSGTPLINGSNKLTLQAVINSQDPNKLDVFSATSDGGKVNITDKIQGGKLAGLYQAKDQVLDNTRTQLNRLSVTLAMTFNEQHKLGIDLDGKRGEDFFTDYNGYNLQLQRAIRNEKNIGDAKFLVNIDPVREAFSKTAEVFGAASNLVNTGTLPQLQADDLTINGYAIRATVAGDDTVSNSDNAGSAIAIAKAINDSVGSLGFTAKAESNLLNLGEFTSGALNGANFQINGTNIDTNGTSTDQMVNDINLHSLATGIKATNDNNQIILTAIDGRNIQVTTDRNAAQQSFTYLNTTGGGAAEDKIQRATVKIQKEGEPITIAGNNPTNISFTAGTVPKQYSSLTESTYNLTYENSNSGPDHLIFNKINQTE